MNPETHKQDSSLTVLPPAFERQRILSVEQAASVLGFSVAHLRRLYRTKKIPAPVRIGGRKLGWPAHVLETMINGAQQNA